MVKEDFHSSKYDRAFKCDTGGRQGERDTDKEGMRKESVMLQKRGEAERGS